MHLGPNQAEVGPVSLERAEWQREQLPLLRVAQEPRQLLEAGELHRLFCGVHARRHIAGDPLRPGEISLGEREHRALVDDCQVGGREGDGPSLGGLGLDIAAQIEEGQRVPPGSVGRSRIQRRAPLVLRECPLPVSERLLYDPCGDDQVHVARGQFESRLEGGERLA